MDKSKNAEARLLFMWTRERGRRYICSVFAVVVPKPVCLDISQALQLECILVKKFCWQTQLPGRGLLHVLFLLSQHTEHGYSAAWLWTPPSAQARTLGSVLLPLMLTEGRAWRWAQKPPSWKRELWYPCLF
jgi:hypothetical protein